MKVKALRSYLGKEGRVHRGDNLDISELRFRELTDGIHARVPLVAATEVGYKMQERVKNKMELAPKNKGRLVNLDGSSARGEAAEKALADPTPSPRFGGRAGAASDASSSEPAPAPGKRKYTRRAEKPASSQSTDRGNWRPGLTSSTPVTSRGGKRTAVSRSSED